MAIVAVERRNISADEAGRMTAFASDLGWGPGEWPEIVAVPTRGGGTLRFDRAYLALVDCEGDLLGYRYFGRDNVHVLEVFND